MYICIISDNSIDVASSNNFHIRCANKWSLTTYYGNICGKIGGNILEKEMFLLSLTECDSFGKSFASVNFNLKLGKITANSPTQNTP